MADVFFLRQQRLCPAGTVSLTTHFHADSDALQRQGSRPVLGVARGVRFSRGYFEQAAELWGDDGELLAGSSHDRDARWRPKQRGGAGCRGAWRAGHSPAGGAVTPKGQTPYAERPTVAAAPPSSSRGARSGGWPPR